MHIFRTGIIAIAAAVSFSLPAVADITKCTGVIRSLPFKITSPGVYCLKKNLKTSLRSGYAIRIASSNVTIDLGGFQILNSAGVDTKMTGIHAVNKKNVTLRNGTIEGFEHGVRIGYNRFGDSRGHLIENLRVVASRKSGIDLSGDGIVIRNNHISGTGGDFVGQPIAIDFVDGNATISNNKIHGVKGRDFSVGINAHHGNVSITGNEIVNVIGDRAVGIHLTMYRSGSQSVIKDNILLNTEMGFFGFGGRVYYSESVTCIDNVVTGYQHRHEICIFKKGNMFPPI